MDVTTYALLLNKLKSKANLVDGKIPASELPEGTINNYIIVTDYSYLPTDDVIEGNLAYCQTHYYNSSIDYDYDKGFYQYLNSQWRYTPLGMQRVDLNKYVGTDLNVTQTYSWTYTDASSFLSQLINVAATGGDIQVDFQDCSLLFPYSGITIIGGNARSSLLVEMNNKQYIATITLDMSDLNNFITLSFQEIEGGSSTGGGSGKLYVYNFTLDTYDSNGKVVANSGKQFQIGIYESNFERLKALETSFSSPQDVVTLINSLSETTTSSGFGNVNKITQLIALCDIKYAVQQALNDTLYNPINASIILAPAIYYDGVLGSEYISLTTVESNVEVAYGLNANNSCTLTKYGTSGGGAVKKELYKFSIQSLMAGPLNYYVSGAQYDNMVNLLEQAGYTINSPEDFEDIYNNGTVLEKITAIGVLGFNKISCDADGYIVTGVIPDDNTGEVTVYSFSLIGQIQNTTCTTQAVTVSTLSID